MLHLGGKAHVVLDGCAGRTDRRPRTGARHDVGIERRPATSCPNCAGCRELGTRLGRVLSVGYHVGAWDSTARKVALVDQR
jgi:hypothetical protein